MRSSKKANKVNKQLVAINNGSLKGTLVLTTAKNSMHMYMPSFKKIRRIGSSDQSGSFLGTALTPGIMNLTRYSIYYTAAAPTVSGGNTTLQLTARGADAPFPKIVLTVDKNHRPTTIKYFNAGGKHVITEERADYTACKGKYCTAKKMTVTDHSSKITSVMKLKKASINGKLKRNGSAVKFSKRELG